MNNLKKIFKFEDANMEYLDWEAEGAIKELSKPDEFIHLPYVEEKVRNMKHHLDTVLSNFQDRMHDAQCRQDFKKFLKKR